MKKSKDKSKDKSKSFKKLKVLAASTLGLSMLLSVPQMPNLLNLVGQIGGANKNQEVVDFYYVKGLISELFETLKVNVTYKAFEEVPAELHPYRTAAIYLGNKLIGYFGAIHPDYAKAHEVSGGYVFEILLESIFNINKPTLLYTPISKVPAVERDLALLISNEQPLGEIIDAIKATDKKMITKVEIFDIFEDEKIGLDKKSVAFRITLEANETLTEEIISSKINKILKSLEYRFHITLRG